MPKFVRFNAAYDQRTVFVNPDLITAVEESTVTRMHQNGTWEEPIPATIIRFTGDMQSVEGTVDVVIEKLEEARRG